MPRHVEKGTALQVRFELFDEARDKWRVDCFGNFGRARVVLAHAKVKPVIHVAAVRLIEPPGALKVTQLYENDSLLLGWKAKPWAEALVDELESKMRQVPKESVRGDLWKREFIAEFLPGSPRLYEHYKDIFEVSRKLAKTKNVPILTARQPRPTPSRPLITDDFDYKSFELRMLGMLSEEDRDRIYGKPTTNVTIKKRILSDSCKPFSLPVVFQPSSPAFNSSAVRDSVIPRLLAASASKSPPSTSA